MIVGRFPANKEGTIPLPNVTNRVAPRLPLNRMRDGTTSNPNKRNGNRGNQGSHEVSAISRRPIDDSRPIASSAASATPTSSSVVSASNLATSTAATPAALAAAAAETTGESVPPNKGNNGANTSVQQPQRLFTPQLLKGLPLFVSNHPLVARARPDTAPSSSTVARSSPSSVEPKRILLIS